MSDHNNQDEDRYPVLPVKARPLQNDAVGKPEEIPDWAPFTSEGLTIDHIVREQARIAFDANTPLKERITVLNQLGKHKGMYIERTETRTVDATKSVALQAMFKNMSFEEKKQWLKENQDNLEAATMSAATSQDEVPTIDVTNQHKTHPPQTVPESLRATPKHVKNPQRTTTTTPTPTQ